MKSIAATLVFCLTAGFLAESAQAEQYTFVVNNKTEEKIVKLLVSENGKAWAPFDLGGGIAAGATAKMVWNETANGQSCKQQVKAVYEDESESEPESFDFCEKDLELDFE